MLLREMADLYNLIWKSQNTPQIVLKYRNEKEETNRKDVIEEDEYEDTDTH